MMVDDTMDTPEQLSTQSLSVSPLAARLFVGPGVPLRLIHIFFHQNYTQFLKKDRQQQKKNEKQLKSRMPET